MLGGIVRFIGVFDRLQNTIHVLLQLPLPQRLEELPISSIVVVTLLRGKPWKTHLCDTQESKFSWFVRLTLASKFFRCDTGSFEEEFARCLLILCEPRSF